jgi:DNA-binding CsgD family transcriptional regulator
MSVLVVVLTLTNGALFATVGIWCAVAARTQDTPSFRALAWLGAVASGAILLGVVQQLALQAHAVGWIPDEAGELIPTDWRLTKAAVTLGLGIASIVIIRRAAVLVHRLGRTVETLTHGSPIECDLDSSGLTAREFDVLGLVASGVISDDELAAHLGIAPSTAKTHLRNIMAKTGIRSRAALLAVAHISGIADERPAHPRTRGGERSPHVATGTVKGLERHARPED